jgi:MoaA/NifB/PqqE/SkfB family radical SAM enzyme
MTLRILYRGPLSSCNYACGYCPFAKRVESSAELAADRLALERFTDWCLTQTHRLGVLFTPWGEALVRKWYQEALIRLTNSDSVVKAAIQTNLSCKLDWVEECDKSKLALWATFHPSEVSMERFVEKCLDLHEREVRFSVGVVGLKEHLNAIEELRRRLPGEIYLWVNAYKRQAEYYHASEVEFLTEIDPLFGFNNQYHPSRGERCRTGESVFSIDGDGTMRRCHFVKEVIGNIYDPNWAEALRERPCQNATCGCHIGYVHLEKLKLDEAFREGILERIPLKTVTGDH